jgi:hypothetical protein
MKRVFIIHGWEGHPEEGWFPWLKLQLENKGFKVCIPKMPNTETPKIGEWIPYLEKMIGTPDEETFLVGHSIGCQTILRYLQRIDVKIGGVVFVAGFVNLLPKTFEEEGTEEIAKPWLETPINWEKIKQNCDNFVAICSTDDPFVPIEDAEIFKDKLNAKILTFENKGHLSEEADIYELPEIVEELEAMQ